MAAQRHLTHVFVHAFMDGRDTLPTSGLGYLEQLQHTLGEARVGQIASVSGRYYAMDRDLRWEKEKQAFDAMVTGHPEGGRYPDPISPHQRTLQQRHHRRVHPTLHLHQPRKAIPSAPSATTTSSSTSTTAPTASARSAASSLVAPVSPTTPSAARASTSQKPPNLTPRSPSPTSPPISTTSA